MRTPMMSTTFSWLDRLAVIGHRWAEVCHWLAFPLSLSASSFSWSKGQSCVLNHNCDGLFRLCNCSIQWQIPLPYLMQCNAMFGIQNYIETNSIPLFPTLAGSARECSFMSALATSGLESWPNSFQSMRSTTGSKSRVNVAFQSGEQGCIPHVSGQL